MNQTLLGFPTPVALALIAMVLVLLGVARMLASLGKPVPLRTPREEHDPVRPVHSAERDQRPH
jgi:heme A synthase